MRIKKGFTLAEVLIVLMVIGVIAMMTLPSMMRGVTEAQTKTAFKKGFNTISGLYSTLRIEGQVPVQGLEVQLANFVAGLVNNMSVKSYILKPVNDAVVAARANLQYGIQYNITGTPQSIGDTTNPINLANGAGMFPAASNATTVGTANAVWFTTEDNLAYAVLRGSTGACTNVSAINAQTTIANAIANSCAVIVIDTNGLNKGPNLLEIQTDPTTGTAAGEVLLTLGADVDLQPLVGDQYYAFVGTNGVTGGNQNATVTGRITADIK